MANSPRVLRGTAWSHFRGFLPFVATAQRYTETHPDVVIHWEKRSLQDFGDYPIQKLAGAYDLIVLDHPCVGAAAGRDVLLRLDEWLPEDCLRDQAEQSVGESNASYVYDGHQWALAIDAAAPVAAWRADLLETVGEEVPQTWEEVLQLARRGLVGVPGAAVDGVMSFFMLCISCGQELFLSPNEVVPEEVGTRALQLLRELIRSVPTWCRDANPIAVYEAMTSQDAIAYCPFAFGYSNYARPGYARAQLQFGGLVSRGHSGPLRSTLGGAGLGISATTRHREQALDYCLYVAGEACQKGIYFDAGGQPGHRAAWTDPEANRRCNQFFQATLPTLDDAYLRPRYDGYIDFQIRAGQVIWSHVWEDRDTPHEVWQTLNHIYRESITGDAHASP